MLGCGVHRHVRRAADSLSRGNVDDATGWRVAQVLERGADESHLSGEQQFETVMPRFFRVGGVDRGADRRSGVIDQHVDAAVRLRSPCRHVFDNPVNGLSIGHVEYPSAGSTSGFGDLVDYRVDPTVA